MLYFALWLVQKPRATIPTNQMQNHNPSQLGHSRFPALQTGCLFFPRVLIGSLIYYPSLTLGAVISMLLFLRHSIEITQPFLFFPQFCENRPLQNPKQPSLTFKMCRIGKTFVMAILGFVYRITKTVFHIKRSLLPLYWKRGLSEHLGNGLFKLFVVSPN